jgi:hypothetical protein
VLDGAKGLKQNLEPLFPHAIFISGATREMK